MIKLYEFTEHSMTVSGTKEDLISLAEELRDAEGIIGDLRYQIEYAFDIDGVRSDNTDDIDHGNPDYTDRYLKTN